MLWFVLTNDVFCFRYAVNTTVCFIAHEGCSLGVKSNRSFTSLMPRYLGKAETRRFVQTITTKALAPNLEMFWKWEMKKVEGVAMADKMCTPINWEDVMCPMGKSLMSYAAF